jgi:AsmA protein
MKTLTRVLIILLALALLALAGGVVFLANLDPNDYKDRIVAEVAKATGREFSLDGPLELGLWPKLRLKTGQFTLGNAEGFGDDPFLVAEEVQVAVATLPLLTRRVEMDTVVLRGLKLNLARNAEGVSNWDDLAAGGGKDSAGDGGSIGALVLGGVDVRDARLTYVDARDGRSVVVDKLNAQTGVLDPGKPVEFKLDASIKSTKPAVDGDTVLSGTVAYDLDAKKYTIAPLAWTAAFRGKNLPGGKAALNAGAAVELDLADGTASIKDLKLDGLGVAVGGNVDVDHLNDARPGGRGVLQVTASDIAVLLKALELPVAQRVAALKERGLDFKTRFDANMDTGEVSVPEFSGRILSATVNGKLSATAANTSTPAIKATLDAGGPDLPSLLLLASQLNGADDKAAQSLDKALAKAKDRSFKFAAEIDADLASGRMHVPTLVATLLGNELTGNIESAGDGKQAFKGSLRASGPDLSALLAASAAVQGADAKAIDSLSAVLGTAQDRSFMLETDLDADLAQGRFTLPKLSATLLGNRIDGKLAATAANTAKPAVKGTLQASGPDLPALLAVIGGMQGGGSSLAALAKDLSKAQEKSFKLETTFDADMAQGRVALPSLAAAGLGLTINGAFQASDIAAANGAVDGKLTVKGTQPGPLLVALGQPELAKRVRSLALDAGFKGSMANLTLSPLSASAEIDGPDKSKPVAVTLNAGSAQADLDKQTLSVKELALTGLGMNIKGSLEATQIKTAPAFSGQLNVAPFNVRKVMTSLGQTLPPMADPQSLTNVGLDTVFKGTAGSLALSGLNVKLDETAIKGQLQIANFTGPDVMFRIDIDRLNADRYLAPAQKGDTRAVTPEAAAAGATQLPLELLRSLVVDGELSIGSLVMSGAKLANVKVKLAGKGGKLEINPATADLYQGRYSGVVGLDATGKEPKLSINTNLAKVAVEPLLVDLTGKSDLSGIVNFEARLSGSGSDSKRLTNTLNGQATFAVQNGVFRGVDVPAVLRAVEVMIESKRPAVPPKGGETQFQSLTGTLDVKNGVVFNKDLLLDGNGFKVTGDGLLANLNDMSIKYDAKIAVDAASTEQGARRYNLGNYTVPVRCRGEISGKSCLPDVGDIAKTAAKDAVKKEIEKKVQDAVGDKAGEALKKLLKF